MLRRAVATATQTWAARLPWTIKYVAFAAMLGTLSTNHGSCMAQGMPGDRMAWGTREISFMSVIKKNLSTKAAK